MVYTYSWAHRHYSLDQLLPMAEQLAKVLYEHPRVTGIAVTGSIARLEDHLHDIDLVIFHEGQNHWMTKQWARDGTVSYPSRGGNPYSSEPQSIFDILSGAGGLLRPIDEIRKEVPLNFISVRERVLTNCQYLWELEGTVYDNDFFARIFCELPLLLLHPELSKNTIANFAATRPHTIRELGPSKSVITFKSLKHDCGNKRCLPSKPWKVRQKERARALQIQRGLLPD